MPNPAVVSSRDRGRAWRQALRLPSFSATLSPVLIGTALAWAMGNSHPLLSLLMACAVIACQAGANLANDYFDYRHGVDTLDRPGSSKVIQQGLLNPVEIRRGMVVSFSLAIALGCLIVAMTNWSISILALACLVVAILYTAGPHPLGYVALGEVAVFLTLGLGLVAGVVFALTGTVSAATMLIALPNACLVTAILHVNNMRDIDRDRGAGKRTVAMILGPWRSRRFYGGLLATSYLMLILSAVVLPHFWPILCVMITLPRAIRLFREVDSARDEAAFNRGLRGGNRLLLEVGVLMSAGLIASPLLT
ncbi:MAG: 1,4-dihydroxy-2-naphthoate octaprenyltransferase [Chloroflexota bacterium]|nr:1,4-dihydroxy-2-naphthoate octaprenyltransferase [Chloroflexota bacterium]